MKTSYDVIVLGLGGIGAGAAYWLARRLQGEVLGIEQFPLFHDRGESQDHSRIIRLSYHTPAYVELAKRAYEAWETLEADAGRKLIVRTGGVDFAPRTGAAIDLEDYARSMTTCNVPYERWDARDLMRHFPQFQVSDDVHALFQSQSGIAPAAHCNATHVHMARAHGAVLLDNVPVTHIDASGGEVTVTAGGQCYSAGKLVIAAGPWSNGAVAHFGMKLPLTVTREQVVYFDAPVLSQFLPTRFPIWIWMDEPCYYGFPLYGEAAVKIAQDVGGYATTAETRTFEVDDANFQRVLRFSQRVLPGAVGPVRRIKTCLYTLTPDRDFVVDTLPGHPNVSIAIGAGHAFKFASQLGRVLSELTLDGATASDIGAFGIRRRILLEDNPTVNWAV